MNIRGILLSVYSFFSLLLVIVFMFLFKNKIHLIRKLWSTSMIKLIDINIQEIGSLDKNADILLLNHNSMLDVILLEHLHDKDIAWVTNKKLAKIPLFGFIFKLPSLILIDPQNRSSLKLMMSRLKEELRNNRPIGIFPEGTRGVNNEMLKFQNGIKIIAEKLNLKVQPIVLTNTRKRLDVKTMRATSGEVNIIYLDTIQPIGEDWYEELEKNFKYKYEQYNGDK